MDRRRPGRREVVAGRQIDIRTDYYDHVPLFDDFELAHRDAARVIDLPVNGEHIVVVAGPFEPIYFSTVLPVIEPVIASLRLE